MGDNARSQEGPMSTLTDFLKEQAEERHSQAAERLRRREEWVASVQRLLNQVKTWLRQADTVNLLELEEGQVVRREEGLETYQVPTLTVRLGDRTLEIV